MYYEEQFAASLFNSISDIGQAMDTTQLDQRLQ
jgi:hypothetical protein